MHAYCLLVTEHNEQSSTKMYNVMRQVGFIIRPDDVRDLVLLCKDT